MSLIYMSSAHSDISIEAYYQSECGSVNMASCHFSAEYRVMRIMDGKNCTIFSPKISPKFQK